MLLAGDLTEKVIGHAVTVHRHTGPGLLESVYEQCLAFELRQAGIACQRQALIPIVYRGQRIGDGFRADLIVENQIIVEVKSAASILPAHEAQLHTYLRLGNLRVGLLMNFAAPRLIDGLKRMVL